LTMNEWTKEWISDTGRKYVVVAPSTITHHPHWPLTKLVCASWKCCSPKYKNGTPLGCSWPRGINYILPVPYTSLLPIHSQYVR
jgi:hypothetical protein